jgi:hypothetical protein
MFRAMALKELREVTGIAVLALAAYGLLVAAMIETLSSLNILAWLFSANSISTGIPFLEDAFVGRFFLISALFAIALGLRQTMGESIRGTYPFLLHRPVGRRWLIGTKLLVGAAVYLACSAVPILAYGSWAATPGTHPSPFQWAMTTRTWIGWLAMTPLYLGAFHAAVRPGRWYRSKLVPLAAATFAAVIAAAFASEFDRSLWPCLIVLVFDVWLIAMILFTVRVRDYP